MNLDKPKEVLVRDIMNSKVISVAPDTSVLDAARIIREHNFDGLPVVDTEHNVVGIITEYDLITKTSGLNANFLQRILSEVKGLNGTESENGNIFSMKVAEIMNTEPLVLKDDATFDEIIRAFVEHHRVNPIPIINNANKLVGIVSRFDVLKPLNLLGYGASEKITK